MPKSSVHISYKRQERDRMYKKYLKIVLNCGEEDGIKPSDYKVLDLASGRGEFLQLLAGAGISASGLDMDEECCRLSSEYAPCKQGNLTDIDKLFPEDSFDVVLMSHVIEHLRDPLTVVRNVMRISKKWVVIAVPNPIRPSVLASAVRRRLYSNKGHYYAWDYSHFINFLSLQCGLEVERLECDEVKIAGKYIRKFFKLLFLLNFLELKLLPKLFPYFSTSLIALVKK